MAKIPEKTNTTVTKIFEWWESKRDLGFREHLGASIIGDKCSRSLWYSFRWATVSQFEGRMLRLFDRGDLEEIRFSEELKGIGCEVVDVDTRTGKQLRLSMLNGHFGGSCDGMVRGLPEAPKTWHIAEYKTHNDKQFKKLVKDGVENSHPKHAAQMTVYMHGFDVERAAYLGANKNDDTIHFERIKLDRKEAQRLIDKAEMIITSDRPPSRISEDAAWFECRFCDHHAVCHPAPVNRVPPPTCRTCIHATPVMSGESATWNCAFHGLDIPNKEAQLEGCASHVYNPGMVEAWADATDAIGDDIEFTVRATGKRFLNGPPSPDGLSVYSSKEVFDTESQAMLGDEFVDQLKTEFDATLVESKPLAGPDEGDQITEREG
jgi:hypothetical protein